ncbi:MAG TPA: hypothetical protein VFF59_01770 [Anaerolineae bacterium]|nr:hypothetical protein [Anaerolineae bacterium]
MRILRLLVVSVATLAALAITSIGLGTVRSGVNETATPTAPHLGYGLNVWDRVELANGLGFDWIELIEEAGPPPATRLPYKVLYRVFVDGYPASIGDYLQHIRDLVSAGRGKIEAYEIGNEPNLAGPGFWGGQPVNPEAYAQLLCDVYPVIKQVDPAAIVVSAGLAPVGPWEPQYWGTVMDEVVYTQRVLARMQALNGGQFCIDAFGYHPHGFKFSPETPYTDAPNGFAFRGAERIHDVMVAAGATTMPMWATEFGWIRDPHFDPWINANGEPSSYGWCTTMTGTDIDGFLWMLVTEQEQADYLVRAFEYADANWPWMGPMFVWNLDLFHRGWSCSPHKFYSLFYASDGDPNQHVPSPAYYALQAMPKRYAGEPELIVQPTALTFLTEVATPTIQTRPLTIANASASMALTWSISIETSSPITLDVSPVTGTNNATVTVSIDPGAITTTGTYTASLIVTADPTTTIGSPITIPIEVLAVEQLHRTYLPIVTNKYATPVPQLFDSPYTHFGVDFISSPDHRADIRYQRAAELNAGLNRWPMYWNDIEQNAVTQPGVFAWAWQDANTLADIQHGLLVDAILLGIPSGLVSGTAAIEFAPRVGEAARFPTERPAARAPQWVSVPIGLYEPVFSDDTDTPGPGKSINPDNRWARFVFAAVDRFRPGGVLAQQQGWTNGQGIRVWEIWNEPDFDVFFTGTVADYTRLLKVGYLAAHHADPNAFILYGGLVTWQKPAWLNDSLSLIAADPDREANHWYFDGVAVHVYSWAWQTFDHLYRARVALDTRGLVSKTLWLNESGVPVCDDDPGSACTDVSNSPYRASMSEQADFLIQSMTFATWLKVQGALWFQLYDDNGNGCPGIDAFGMVRNLPGTCNGQDGTTRPAFDTYKLIAQQLSDVLPYWRKRPGVNQEIIAFKRPATSERVVVMWNRYYTTTETVVLTATATSALLLYPDGLTQPIVPISGTYTIELPPATNDNTPTSDGKAPIGGPPRILIEYDPDAK